LLAWSLYFFQMLVLASRLTADEQAAATARGDSWLVLEGAAAAVAANHKRVDCENFMVG
jgi:hypothetical protein